MQQSRNKSKEISNSYTSILTFAPIGNFHDCGRKPENVKANHTDTRQTPLRQAVAGSFENNASLL